jgi:hypothetical protein
VVVSKFFSRQSKKSEGQKHKFLSNLIKNAHNGHEKPSLLGHNIESQHYEQDRMGLMQQLGSMLPSKAGIQSLDSKVLEISMTKQYFTSDLSRLSMAVYEDLLNHACDIVLPTKIQHLSSCVSLISLIPCSPT